MSQFRQLQTLTRYRAWADRLLYQSLAAMPGSSLTREQPIVFGSILRTLNHVHCMDQVWKAHLEGVTHGFTSRNPDDCPAFDMLRDAQTSSNDWYIDLAETLDEQAWDETIHFTFIGGGQGAMASRRYRAACGQSCDLSPRTYRDDDVRHVHASAADRFAGVSARDRLNIARLEGEHQHGEFRRIAS